MAIRQPLIGLPFGVELVGELGEMGAGRRPQAAVDRFVRRSLYFGLGDELAQVVGDDDRGGGT